MVQNAFELKRPQELRVSWLGHPAVRLVAVTGSVHADRAIAAACAEGLKRVHLELGGNAPVVVHGDVDVEATAADHDRAMRAVRGFRTPRGDD